MLGRGAPEFLPCSAVVEGAGWLQAIIVPQSRSTPLPLATPVPLHYGSDIFITLVVDSQRIPAAPAMRLWLSYSACILLPLEMVSSRTPTSAPRFHVTRATVSTLLVIHAAPSGGVSVATAPTTTGPAVAPTRLTNGNADIARSR
jgi:hypothetical protein